MSVIHLVLFKFKDDVSKEDVQNVCTNMLGLKDKCVHPESKQAYIKTSQGGKDNSPEGRQDGLTHAFVVEFASVKDRDYYVHEDPAHQQFVKSVGPHVSKITVVDFTPGQW